MQYNLVLADGRWRSSAGKVTAGLAESNGSLPLGGWLKVILVCGLTACKLESAPAQRSVMNMAELYLFYLTSNFTLRHNLVCLLPLPYTVKISVYPRIAYIAVSFPFLTEPVSYTFVFVNRRNDEARAHIAMYMDPSTTKFGGLPPSKLTPEWGLTMYRRRLPALRLV